MTDHATAERAAMLARPRLTIRQRLRVGILRARIRSCDAQIDEARRMIEGLNGGIAWYRDRRMIAALEILAIETEARR